MSGLLDAHRSWPPSAAVGLRRAVPLGWRGPTRRRCGPARCRRRRAVARSCLRFVDVMTTMPSSSAAVSSAACTRRSPSTPGMRLARVTCLPTARVKWAGRAQAAARARARHLERVVARRSGRPRRGPARRRGWRRRWRRCRPPRPVDGDPEQRRRRARGRTARRRGRRASGSTSVGRSVAVVIGCSPPRHERDAATVPTDSCADETKGVGQSPRLQSTHERTEAKLARVYRRPGGQ